MPRPNGDSASTPKIATCADVVATVVAVTGSPEGPVWPVTTTATCWVPVWTRELAVTFR